MTNHPQTTTSLRLRSRCSSALSIHCIAVSAWVTWSLVCAAAVIKSLADENIERKWCSDNADESILLLCNIVRAQTYINMVGIPAQIAVLAYRTRDKCWLFLMVLLALYFAGVVIYAGIRNFSDVINDILSALLYYTGPLLITDALNVLLVPACFGVLSVSVYSFIYIFSALSKQIFCALVRYFRCCQQIPVAAINNVLSVLFIVLLSCIWSGVFIASIAGKYCDFDEEHGLNYLFDWSVLGRLFSQFYSFNWFRASFTEYKAIVFFVLRLYTIIYHVNKLLLIRSVSVRRYFLDRDDVFIVSCLSLLNLITVSRKLEDLKYYIGGQEVFGLNRFYSVVGLVLVNYSSPALLRVVITVALNLFPLGILLLSCSLLISATIMCLKLLVNKVHGFCERRYSSSDDSISVDTGMRSAESVITTPRGSRNCCASLFSFCSSRQRYRRVSDVTVLTGMRSEESFDLEYGDRAGLALAKAQ